MARVMGDEGQVQRYGDGGYPRILPLDRPTAPLRVGSDRGPVRTNVRIRLDDCVTGEELLELSATIRPPAPDLRPEEYLPDHDKRQVERPAVGMRPVARRPNRILVEQ